MAAVYLCDMLWIKIKQRLRWTRMQAAFGMGLGAHALRDRPGLRVCIYHGVVPAPVKRINARFISTQQLDAQLGYAKQHFQMISMDEAFAGDYDHSRLAVAVTFDDGYLNNLRHALPVLQKHGIPATVFVTAPRAAGQDILWPDLLDIASAVSSQPIMVEGLAFHKNRKGEYVDAQGQRLKGQLKLRGAAFKQAMMAAFEGARFRGEARWADYWQLMDASELKALADADGITIGGHGTLHHNLDGLPLDEALQDVKIGLQWIEKAIGKPVKAFAFPDGAYTPALVDGIAALGIDQLLLDNYRFQDQADARLLDRFTIHPWLPTRVLIAEMLRGSYL
jgi:peptidoglycan/xylan/chitin deacetylase (PgdA/CDA1 family)